MTGMFLLIVSLLVGTIAQEQEQLRNDNLCWSPIRDAETYFGSLSVCLNYQRGEQFVRDWDAMLRRQGFRLDPPTSKSRWSKSDPTGTLSVNAVFEGEGVRANLIFAPPAPIQVAPVILEMLTTRANSIREYSPRSVQLLRAIERGYENCTEEEGHRVLLDGRMAEALWNLNCLVR